MINLNRKRKRPMIPMSSMSDIGFLLLIFIMLISLMNQRHEEAIDYTEARQLEKTQENDNLEIWIEADGAMYVDGEQVSARGLEILIAEAVEKKPDTRIHIIADRNTPYRNINSAVRVLQTLQHRVVSFVVQEETE